MIEENRYSLFSYIDISNLALINFNEVEEKVKGAISSADPWERYWALITCSTFEEQALYFKDKIKEISKTDIELINKVRAAEFLGLTKTESPVKVMTNTLYKSKDPAEALLILNSIVLMNDNPYSYHFKIDSEKIEEWDLKDFMTSQL